MRLRINVLGLNQKVGWDGKPRPTSLRPKADSAKWPEAVEGRSDTFGESRFWGPLGEWVPDVVFSLRYTSLLCRGGVDWFQSPSSRQMSSPIAYKAEAYR